MLSLLVWAPVIGAVIIGLWPGSLNSRQVRRLALGIAGAVFVLTLVMLGRFDLANPGIQLHEFVSWLPLLGLTYSLGVDGLSLPLLVLSNLLVTIAIYSSGDVQRPRLYYSLMLILGAGVAGAFLSQNLLLFFLFYEVELVPLYLLIAIWGGSRRNYAAMKFLLYTAVSDILLVAAFFGMVWLSHSPGFEYSTLQTALLPLPQQITLLVIVVLGFGIKIPLVPFHTWLPDAHVEASTPVSVMLAGILLKLGTYGLIRFGLELLPQGWQALAPWLTVLAVINVLYGSLNAISQQDMKKIVAFSSIAHMGYVILASAAATPLSILAAVLQMISHGLISALMFLLVGVVYTKTGTRDVNLLSGLLNPERGLPVVGSLVVLGAMANAGIPGMIGFVSEFLIFRSSFPVFPIQTLLCMLGTGLTAVYFLLMINRVFFGRLSARVMNIPQSLWSERLPAVLLAVIIVVLGLQPGWIIPWSEATTTAAAVFTTTFHS